MNLSATFIPPLAKIINSDILKNYKIKFSINNNFEDVYFHFLLINFAKTAILSTKFYINYHRYNHSSLSFNIEKNPNIYFYHFMTLYDLICHSEINNTNIDSIIYIFIAFLNAYKSNVQEKMKYNTLLQSIITNYKYKIKKILSMICQIS